MGSKLGKVLTSDNLQKKGQSLVNRCFMCKWEGKSIDHILRYNVDWVISSLVKDTLLSWHDSFVWIKRKKVWKVAFLCIFWTIWRESNQRAFETKNKMIKS